MADHWYYARGEQKLGPFSARQLKDLAAAGRILSTDTIWKEGIEKGVSAAKVKNLLPVTPARSSAVDRSGLSASAPPPVLPPTEARDRTALVDPGPETPPAELLPGVAALPETSVSTPALAEGKQQVEDASETAAPLPGEADQVFDEEPAPIRPPPRSQPSQPRKGRAVAVKGAVIVSQDGQVVQYRKKCGKCGQEDTFKHRMPIRHGVTRASFFCPKCRKLSPVEIQGML